MSDSRPPLSVTYALANGDRISLFSGSGSIDGHAAMLDVWQELHPQREIRWRATYESARAPDSLDGEVELICEPLSGFTKVLGAIGTEGLEGGIVSRDLTDIDRDVAAIRFHWLNIPQVSGGDCLSIADRDWAGRWTCEVAGRKLLMDARPDIMSFALPKDRRDRDVRWTHVGEIARSDGSPFSAAAGMRVVEAWQDAISFALGRHVSALLPRGLARDGSTLWASWNSWYCDRWDTQESWWSPHDGEGLLAFVQLFVTRVLVDATREPVSLLARHIVEANKQSMVLEARLMITQAALEYLAWYRLVVSGRIDKSSYEGLKAAGRLRLLLSEAGLDDQVPTEMPDLLAKSKVLNTGTVDTIVWLRNRLTHPKRRNEPYELQGLLRESWQRLISWAELLLLHEIGYKGEYQLRSPFAEFRHVRRPVPWAPSATTGDR